MADAYSSSDTELNPRNRLTDVSETAKRLTKFLGGELYVSPTAFVQTAENRVSRLLRY